MIRLRDIPGTHTQEAKTLEHAAATATETRPIFVAPFACTVTNVKVVAQAAVTGTATNYTNLNVVKMAGTPVEIGNYDLSSGNNLVANTVKDIDVTDTALAEDGVLYLQFEKVVNGLLVPELMIQTEFKSKTA